MRRPLPGKMVLTVVTPPESGVVRRKHGNFAQRFLNKFRLSGGKQRSVVLTTPLRGDDHWNSKADDDYEHGTSPNA